MLKKVDGMISLSSGPQVGDRVVVDGIQRLKPGSSIVDMNQLPKPAATTATTEAAKPAAPTAATEPAKK
jgi:hypothetical protein